MSVCIPVVPVHGQRPSATVRSCPSVCIIIHMYVRLYMSVRLSVSPLISRPSLSVVCRRIMRRRGQKEGLLQTLGERGRTGANSRSLMGHQTLLSPDLDLILFSDEKDSLIIHVGCSINPSSIFARQAFRYALHSAMSTVFHFGNNTIHTLSHEHTWPAHSPLPHIYTTQP